MRVPLSDRGATLVQHSPRRCLEVSTCLARTSLAFRAKPTGRL